MKILEDDDYYIIYTTEGIFNLAGVIKPNVICMHSKLQNVSKDFHDHILEHELKHLINDTLWNDLKIDFVDLIKDYTDKDRVKAYYQMFKMKGKSSKASLPRAICYASCSCIIHLTRVILYPYRLIQYFRLWLEERFKKEVLI